MKGRYVLAIECDWRLRKLIRANLEAVGLIVREAVGGPHGLQMLGDSRPDLILLDLDLPDMDAWHLLGALGARFADRPVPIVALCTEPPDRRLLHHAQLAACLQKPFSASALLEQVQGALGSTSIGE
jgi:CheY-like chemotaxis protein